MEIMAIVASDYCHFFSLQARYHTCMCMSTTEHREKDVGDVDRDAIAHRLREDVVQDNYMY